MAFGNQVVHVLEAKNNNAGKVLVVLQGAAFE
jgi:hypothetical protein